MSILEDELEDLENDLKDSDDAVEQGEGAVEEAAQSTIQQHLTQAEGHIDLILDPNSSPSLQPPGAGVVESSPNSATLAEVAKTCRQLGEEANAENKKSSPNHHIIGGKLRTIKDLLPTYRQLAGIT